MDERTYVKRRRVPRRQYRGRIGLLHRGKYEIVWSTQIGEGGMMVVSANEMEVGDHIVLTFKPPGVEQTVVQSIIRFKTDDESGAAYKYGIEFLNLEFQAKRQIRTFVASKQEADFKLAV